MLMVKEMMEMTDGGSDIFAKKRLHVVNFLTLTGPLCTFTVFLCDMLLHVLFNTVLELF